MSRSALNKCLDYAPCFFLAQSSQLPFLSHEQAKRVAIRVKKKDEGTMDNQSID